LSLRLAPIVKVHHELNHGSFFEALEDDSTIIVKQSPIVEVHHEFNHGTLFEAREYDSTIIAKQYPTVLIMQFSDEHHLNQFIPQHKSVKCWAEEHGYRYLLADPLDFPDCNRQDVDWFHRMLCALYHTMVSNEDVDYFVKIDGDVVGGASPLGLEHWIDDGADVIVQERLYTAEVNAGFYILKNSFAAIEFVHTWMEYAWKLPGGGYHGMDNGSLHLALLDFLHLKGREECWDLYRGLNGTLTSYFEYVACARRLLGPPRRHHNTTLYKKYGGLKVTLWPAMFGPMMDLWFLPDRRNRLYYPLHHGIKDIESQVDIYGEIDSIGHPEYLDGHCVLYEKQFANREVFDEMYTSAQEFTLPLFNHEFSEGMTKCYEKAGPHYHNRVPRFSIKYQHDCEKGYLDCQPLGPTDLFNDKSYRCTGPTNTDKDEELKGLLKMIEVDVNEVPMYEDEPQPKDLI